MANDKNDVCLCEICKHRKANDCIQSFKCKCCVEADTIRLKHPVAVSGEADEARDMENEEMEKEYFGEADPDVL